MIIRTVRSKQGRGQAMNFKEYEQRRDALLDSFCEKAEPYHRSGDIETWRKLRKEFSVEFQALHAQWKANSQEGK